MRSKSAPFNGFFFSENPTLLACNSTTTEPIAMLIARFKFPLAAGLIAFAGLVNGQTPPGATDQNFVVLPGSALFAMENKGKFAVATDTGRFIMQGTLYDVWDQKEITTLEEARYAATHIPLDKAEVGFADLVPLSVGEGDTVSYLFSDIQCGHCKTIINEARNVLPSGHRLDVILLPLLGPESTVRTAEILCAKDKAAAWQAMVTGDMKTPLPPEGQCDGDVLQKRLVTAQFLGARNVPFLIRDDGLVQEGRPVQGLRNWILSNRKESE